MSQSYVSGQPDFDMASPSGGGAGRHQRGVPSMQKTVLVNAWTSSVTI